MLYARAYVETRALIKAYRSVSWLRALDDVKIAHVAYPYIPEDFEENLCGRYGYCNEMAFAKCVRRILDIMLFNVIFKHFYTFTKN